MEEPESNGESVLNILIQVLVPKKSLQIFVVYVAVRAQQRDLFFTPASAQAPSSLSTRSAWFSG